REFFLAANADREFEVRESNSRMKDLPPLVITDLRELNGITAAIHRNGSRHISVHDLGLAQCQSDVVIDGSITQLFPYPPDKSRTFYVGPQYMVTRGAVMRARLSDTVLIAVGGGSLAGFEDQASDLVRKTGLTPIVTSGSAESGAIANDE